MTDQSFGPSCDVNRIVKHYETTGIDPFIDRKKLERYDVASEISYEAAMRAKSEIDSAFALLPSSERLKHDNDANSWFESISEPITLTDALEPAPEPPAEPALDPPAEVGTE